MTTELIAQVIGFIAFAFGVAAFLQKNDVRLKLLLAGQSLTLGVHFYLLGAFTGVAAVWIAAARNILSIYPWARKFAPVFYLSTLVFGYLTFNGWIDYLPILSGLVGTTALFYLSGFKMRAAFAICSALWLTHNIYIGSIFPSLMEALMLCIGIYRTQTLFAEHRKALTHDTPLIP